MSQNEPRYYDPETGRPNLDEWLEVIGQSDAESTVRELARLQRERDEARGEAATQPTTIMDLARQRDDAYDAYTLGLEALATERAAREKAERERDMVVACNKAMREPMMALRKAMNMPAQGEGAVIADAIATIATLRAELRQARELIRDLAGWHGHLVESELELWERIASEFQADTGMLRPGKSQSPERYHSDEERQARFREWCDARHNGLTLRIRCALRAENERLRGVVVEVERAVSRHERSAADAQEVSR